ncbi:MAG: undecaprenyl-diphosphate phosphatase [Thermodesulfovibrionales bacterium]|nr:undecaprenyl-diphosphate phosphatase [Thermodesulfovibrionales bacterium]
MNPEILKALFLGIIQGLTEFLPISSTAHLILIPWIFNWQGDVDTLTFDVAIHGGTLLSLLICFYRDWLTLLIEKREMLIYILLATIPAGLAGLFLRDVVENAFRNPLMIVVSLVSFGILMLFAEKFYRNNIINQKVKVSFLDALFIGCAQAIALIPGVSRSGVTITAGLFRKINRHEAARFSFLLSTPVIGGAFILEGLRIVDYPQNYSIDLMIAGFLSAAISGYIAIKFLLNFLKRYPLNLFVYYRFALAVIILSIWLNQ